MGFDTNFIWGAATAAYQVEGGASEDNRGLSIWDIFSHQDGKVFNNENGDIACDHYHRVDEDIALMKKCGLKAYRFSISWSRILPDGIEKINQAGIDFYNNLIDKLLQNEIEPYITLYHWDLPYALHCKGGWLNREIADWFGEYSKIIAENFSDRVKNFMTINEPNCVAALGYKSGKHAPGYKVTDKELIEICHNILLAQGQSVKMLRKYAKQKINIGFVLASFAYCPATDKKEDVEAAKAAYNNPTKDNFAFCDSFWLDPIFYGKYPDSLKDYFNKNAFEPSKEDMELIAQKLDFLGQNVYFGEKFSADVNGLPVKEDRPAGAPRNACYWGISPEALYYAPKNMYEKYHIPVFITENGLSCADVVSLDGKVHDYERINFLQRYLLNLEKAVDDGVDVRGYFTWSFMDNFEWNSGYQERFGIVYVDYTTQERILKDSAYWYKKVIETNGKSLSDIKII